MLMKFSNDVEKYVIEVTEMGRNSPLFLQYVSVVGHTFTSRYEQLVTHNAM